MSSEKLSRVFEQSDWDKGIFFCENPRRYLIVKSLLIGASSTFLFGTVLDIYAGVIADRWFSVHRSKFTHTDVANSGNSYVGRFECDNFISIEDCACPFPSGLIDWFRVRLSRIYAQPCAN